MNNIWITWENQTRNRGMASLTKSDFFELTSNKPRLIRYAALSFRTLAIIVRRRPRVVYCQNPSIVLALLCLLSKAIFRHKIVVDQHNSGLFPLEGESPMLQAVADFIVKRCDVSIVSNRHLAEHVEELGGTAVVIPDPLPDLEAGPPSAEIASIISGRTTATVICGWAKDEPFDAILTTARLFEDTDMQFLFTGKPPESIRRSQLPSNVKLLGFVCREDYIFLLKNSDLAIILTLRENCLNCGAYEALEAGSPAVLSDTTALRENFSAGFEFASAEPESLKEAISRILKNDKNHTKEELKKTRNKISKKTTSGALKLLEFVEKKTR